MFSIEKLIKINDAMIGMFKVLYLNLLWGAFTLLGLGVLGFGPATYAMSKYLDQWLRLKNHPPITKSFWQYYKERFWQANAIGWLCLAAFGIVTVNLFMVKNGTLRLVNVAFLLLFVIAFMYIFKVMVAIKFDRIYEIIRGAFLLGFGYLLQTLIAVAVLVVAYLLAAAFVPVLLVLFGVGFVGLVQCITGNLILGKLYGKTV